MSEIDQLRGLQTGKVRAYAKLTADGKVVEEDGCQLVRRGPGDLSLRLRSYVHPSNVKVQSNGTEDIQVSVRGCDDNTTVSIAINTMSRSPSDPMDSDVEIVVME